MKHAKKMLALLLALCMLIGLPMAVQANDTAEEFKVVKVVEMPANKATSELPAGRTLLVYFNHEPTAESLANLGATSANGKPLFIRCKATGEGLAEKDMGCNFVASYGTNPIAVTFGNATENNLPALRAAGYDNFSFYMAENNTGTASDKGYIKDFTDENGTMLTANLLDVVKYEKSETAITAEPFEITKVEILHDNYATEQLPAGRTLLVYFTNDVDPASFDLVGSDKKLQVRVAVDGREGDMTGNIVPSYGTNPIAVTFGNTTTNNIPAFEAAGYGDVSVVIKERGTGTAADKGWIDGFVDVNGTALTGNITGSQQYEQVQVVAQKQLFFAAKIGETGYETFDAAMADAKNGDTVTLYADAAVNDVVFVLNAGVTLDLNGYELTVKNVMAFGQVTDSTEGEGKLVVAKTANTILLSDNEALPMYDEDGYRFFTYELVAKGCHVVTEGSVNQYGVSIIFKDVAAYELLANNADTCGVQLCMDMLYDGKHGMDYKFQDEFIKTYAQACVDVMNGGNSPAKKTIILTISGLNGKSLEVDSVINALPYGEAHIVQNRVDNNTLSAGPTA